MAKPCSSVPRKFPFDLLRNLLTASNKLCIVGYLLSSEAQAPHYYDILRGVWSNLTPQSKINPFNSSKDAQTVMNWIHWRRRGIRTSQPSRAFQSLRKLQQALNLVVATQCVDGLIHANEVENVHDLYGNVLHARCYDNAHIFPLWPQAPNAECLLIHCEQCGSMLFPDVEMFGWNSKAATRRDFMNLFDKADLLITIGADQDLAPFNESGKVSPNVLPVVEILPDGIALKRGVQVFTAKNKDIKQEIESAAGRDVIIADRGGASYDATMNYLLQLIASHLFSS